jgi:putative ABC transport system permease protein
MRGVLVVIQVATALTLLVGAGLLLGSFVRLVRVDPGYDPDNLLTFQIARPMDRLDPRPFADGFIERIRSLPGVRAVAATNSLPLSGTASVGLMVQGLPSAAALAGPPAVRMVTQDYVDAMGMRVVEGRSFNNDDREGRQPMAALVNHAAVRLYFGGTSPVGALLTGQVNSWEIVGVVDDIRHVGLDADPTPEIYMDLRQGGPSSPFAVVGGLGIGGALFYAVRVEGDPYAVIPNIRTVLREMDSRATLELNVRSMQDRLSRSVTEPRFYAVLLGAFAGIAAILAVIGIYGVIAWLVRQRTREIGIRIALGAHPGRVVGLVLKDGLRPVLIGIAFGLGGAVATTRFLGGMLFGLTPLDPGTFVFVSITFALVAALACYGPARRAAKVDPLVALRHE